MENNILIVVDMQNDFLTGSLANPDALALVPKINNLMKSVNWTSIILTQDTHAYNYLNTAEGRKLPVPHCIEGTAGWCIEETLYRTLKTEMTHSGIIITKSTFGANWDDPYLESIFGTHPDKIVLVGTCTDICVVTNALLLKTRFPAADVIVYENLCAGSTPEKHNAALEVLKSCQVTVCRSDVEKEEN